MDKDVARWCWEDLCWESIGVDDNGKVVERKTGFGHFVSGAGLIGRFPWGEVEQKAVAKFLRDWADAIEGIVRIKKEAFYAENGLLWRKVDDSLVELPEADYVAEKLGFICAERFVKELQKDGGEKV